MNVVVAYSIEDFYNDPMAAGIGFEIEENELATIMKIAERNKLEISILFKNEEE